MTKENQPEFNNDVQQEQIENDCNRCDNQAKKAADEKISLDDLGDQAMPKSASIKKLENELAELKDKYLRLAAEYDNFRKRTAKERDNIFSDAYVSAIKDLLPIYDSIERAVAQPCSDKEFKKGIDLIMRQFCDIFNRIEVEETPGAGEQFNPEFHNAVIHVDDETIGENVVVEVMQKGFLIKGRVVRYAMVKSAN